MENLFSVYDVSGEYYGTVSNRFVAWDEAKFYSRKLGIECFVRDQDGNRLTAPME